MSNNFRKTAVLEKKYEFKTKASLLTILLKIFEGVTLQLHALESLFKIFFTFVRENFYPCRL